LSNIFDKSNNLLIFVSATAMKPERKTKKRMKTSILNAAMKLAIMDAIEKGHTNSSDLAAYAATDKFKCAVKRYYDLLITL
jgi:hypothetical protein